ncbi:MAG: ABC transporter ATP-binding protein [Clostridium sp.]
MSSLKVKELSYKYKNHKALNNISFNIESGLVGILGENGAGKSTLIKLISTLLPIQDGRIELNEIIYNKNLKNVRGHIGYLPQDFQVYDNLTGKEFLEIIASLKLEGNKAKYKEECNELINELSMDKFINRKIREYSGGMKQKLGIAQALVGNPDMVILDEPTVGLDPKQRNMIRELFPYISLNKIVIVTTHIVEDIENYCKYLIVMKEGNIIYQGGKKEFVNSVSNLLWEGIVEEKDLLYIKSKVKILSTYINEDIITIRYISKEKLFDSHNKGNISLQDAYIIHYELHGEE